MPNARNYEPNERNYVMERVSYSESQRKPELEVSTLIARLCAHPDLTPTDKAIGIVMLTTGEMRASRLMKIVNVSQSAAYRSVSRLWELAGDYLVFPVPGNECGAIPSDGKVTEKHSQQREEIPSGGNGTDHANARALMEYPTDIHSHSRLARPCEHAREEEGLQEKKLSTLSESMQRVADRLAQLQAGPLGSPIQHIDVATNIVATSIDLYGPERILVAMKDLERTKADGKQIRNLWRAFDAFCQRAEAPKKPEELSREADLAEYRRQCAIIAGVSLNG